MPWKPLTDSKDPAEYFKKLRKRNPELDAFWGGGQIVPPYKFIFSDVLNATRTMKDYKKSHTRMTVAVWIATIALILSFCPRIIEAWSTPFKATLVIVLLAIAVTSIARRLKQESTRELWKRYPDWLRHQFWKERTFWSDGYFVCSIGGASPETVRKYIENQG